MDEPEQKPDAELLFALRMEYARAVRQEDYSRIDTVIVPRFLEHFGKHYEKYSRDWKNLSLSRPSVRVVIDPRQGEEIRMEWADSVLNGQTDLDL
jgi:hypothetical protein